MLPDFNLDVYTSFNLWLPNQCLLEIRAYPKLQSDSFNQHSDKGWRVFTWLLVPYTVIWRVFEVHQVILAGSFEVCVRGSETSAVLVDGHLHSAVVLLSKVIPSAPEVGHGQPAGPNAAWPADAVTFTLQSHEALHRLARREGENRK